MEIISSRFKFTDKSTISKVFVDGEQKCFFLEDVDRGLDDSMTVEQIAAIKVYGKTAIPYGRYEIAVTWSNRFQMMLPLLLNVKGFDGIRVHWGNKPENTDGCPLAGESIAAEPDMILNSKIAFNALFSLIKEAISREKAYITITKAQAV